MTPLQRIPDPENYEKGENLHPGGVGARFLPFSPFSGTGTAGNPAPDCPYAAALAAVRAYRRMPPPKPARPPRLRAAPAKDAMPDLQPPGLPTVPPTWREGVARLARLPAPPAITPHRWAAYAASAARLLRYRGAELHAHGWDALNLFGLYAAAPARYPPGWGLAWLLGEDGSVLDVSPAAVGITFRPGGSRLAYTRPSAAARAGVVPAWTLA